LPAAAPAAGRGQTAPTVLPARSPVPPSPVALGSVVSAHPPDESERGVPSISPQAVTPGASTALPQFDVSAASLGSDDTEADEDRPSSGGLALLSSFRSL
jgi:hypothetical protein